MRGVGRCFSATNARLICPSEYFIFWIAELLITAAYTDGCHIYTVHAHCKSQNIIQIFPINKLSLAILTIFDYAFTIRYGCNIIQVGTHFLNIAVKDYIIGNFLLKLIAANDGASSNVEGHSYLSTWVIWVLDRFGQRPHTTTIQGRNQNLCCPKHFQCLRPLMVSQAKDAHTLQIAVS